MATTNLGLTLINQSDNISPTPINDNMEALDALGVDYITAQGISGEWYYRRWNSGTYECWQVNENAYGYTENYRVARTVTFPVTFAEAPVVEVTAGVSGDPACYVSYVRSSTSNVQWYVTISASTNVGNSIYSYLYVIGRLS